MLENTVADRPTDGQLNVLAEFMAMARNRVPAGYTYLGQFVDHDIALDSAFLAGVPPWNTILVSSISNKRNPFLNLETIYGYEARRFPDEPTRKELLKDNSNTILRLDDTIPGVVAKQRFLEKDLPRRKNSPLALIVDPRNDENLAVAQTQVLFMRFHNEVVRRYFGGVDTAEIFESARKMVILHYQWIVLRDYLPRILKKSVLDDVEANGNQFYHPDPVSPFMPLEFSVAAFRAGHSMIRDSYNWNRLFNDDPFPDVLPATLYDLGLNTGPGGLGNGLNLVSDWAINWRWFYDLPGNSQNQKLNYASGIDTNIAKKLGFLPDRNGIPDTFSRETSLVARDLYRARAFGLPSGQEVARTMLGSARSVLAPEQIADLLPGPLKYKFSGETPLWFYLLAEAEIQEHGQTLGEVGSRIMAETFVKLIRLSTPSIFGGGFQPDEIIADGSKEFGMAQLLKYVAGGKEEELNPLERVDLCTDEVKKAIEKLHSERSQ